METLAETVVVTLLLVSLRAKILHLRIGLKERKTIGWIFLALCGWIGLSN